MRTDEKLELVLGAHQHVCKLITFRKKLTKKEMPFWLFMLRDSSTLSILMVLRYLLDEGKFPSDITIQVVLKDLYKDGAYSVSEYNQKLKKLESIQRMFQDDGFESLINKGFAHLTTERNSILNLSESAVDNLINKISDFLEKELWTYCSQSDKIEFQASIVNYQNFWNAVENDLLSKDILREI